MKTKIKIAVITVIGMYLNVNAQNKIESTGNVGIGTITPKALLEIAKTPASYVKPFILTDGSGKYNFFTEYPSGGQNYLNMYMRDENNVNKVKLTPQGNSYFNGGNFGIGTLDPKHKLDINTGGGNFKTYLYGVEHTVNTAGGWARGFRLRNENDNQTVVFGANSGNAYISTGFDVDVDVTGYQNQKLTINKAGNVGIGTTTPTAKLDVNGNIKVTSSWGSWITGKTGTGGITYDTQLKVDKYHSLLRQKTSSGHFVNLGGLRDYFGFFGYDKDRTENGFDHSMVMNLSTGNVGIGTLTTGSHKLAVEGSIGAREIKVEGSGWSDFVFEKNYELPTLENVEKHIKEKGHLQDIPSAKEVEKNGFFLGEMDAKLLQKIEELTLYTIQQEKKIKELEKMVKKLLENKN